VARGRAAKPAPPASIDLLEEIRALCALPPRLPCSPGERLGHDRVAAVLERLGFRPSVEPFRAVTTAYGRIALHSGVAALAGSVGLAIPPLAALMAGGAAVSLFGDLEQRFRALSRLLPEGESRNVVAVLPAAASSCRRLVVMAHVDVAREGPEVFFEPDRARLATRFFRDRFGRAPNPVQVVLAAALLQAGFHAGSSVGLPGRLPAWALSQLQWFVAAAVGRAALFNRPVAGASDDAAGVAVLLALAERLAADPLRATEVWFVATGCEESGLYGPQALLRRHADALGRPDTWFLALDTLGAGTVRWCTGEGFARHIRFDPAFASLAERVAAEPGAPPALPYANPFATDALVPALRGYRALSLIALDEDDYPPNYHWRTDVPENVDPATPRAALDFAERLARRLDEVP
jgi:hypothetical protein